MNRLIKNEAPGKFVVAISIMAIFLQSCAAPRDFFPGYRDLAENYKQVNLYAKYQCEFYAYSIKAKTAEFQDIQSKGQLDVARGFVRKLQAVKRIGLTRELAAIAEDCSVRYKKRWAIGQSISASHSKNNRCRWGGIWFIPILTAPVGISILIYCYSANYGAPHIYNVEVKRVGEWWRYRASSPVTIYE